MRARRIAIAAVIVSALAGTTLFLLRRKEEQRIANLEACLFGDPLAKGELPSTRMLAIELARLHEKMTTRMVGMRSQLVPEKPIPQERRWPDRCMTRTVEAMPLAWTFGLSLKGELEDLNVKLNEGEQPSNVNAVFRPGRFAVTSERAASDVERPWAPVIFTVTPSELGVNGEVEKLCAAHTMLATLDHWDDDLVLLGGKNGCAITSGGGRRLAGLRKQEPTDKMMNSDTLTSGRVAVVQGKTLTIDDSSKVATYDGVTMTTATEFRTCSSNGVRAVLLEHGELRKSSLRFIDANGPIGRADDATFQFTEPDFSERGKFGITFGPRTMSCRGNEARIAWSWSTAIDQRSTHKIMIATCTPERCTTDSARVVIDTPHWQNCGFCDPNPNEGSVEAPTVVDLFDAVAVMWHERHTVRARIAPLIGLEKAPELVLWYTAEGGWFEPPRIIARGSIALVGLRLTFEKAPAESRLFRLEVGVGGASKFNVTALNRDAL